MERQELIRLLQRWPLFRGLPVNEICAVAGAAHCREIDRNQFFFRAGAPADEVYILNRGCVKLTQAGDGGAAVVVRLAGAGDPLGIDVFMNSNVGERYQLSAQAVRWSQALTWTTATMTELIKRYPDIARNALREVSGWMRELRERYLELATEPVDRRIAHALLRLATQIGWTTKEGILLIDIPLSRQDLGAMTGATLFTVSRVLRGWQRRGIVDAGRERVTILQPTAMRAIAGASADRPLKPLPAM